MTEAEGSPAVVESRREQVRDRYGAIAAQGSCGSPGADSQGCCSPGAATAKLADPQALTQIGYAPEELSGLPEGANLGLGCGNPTALLALKLGETVLDLGSGAGIDCFLASRKVGPQGHVIGVDMTAEMVAKARENARKGDYSNVEFRLGEIEHLPAADRSVDVVISNCVINLSPEKDRVYREAFRVLRPGGRFAVSDVVATRPITAEERADPALWCACSSGALEIDRVRELLGAAGFEAVDIQLRTEPTIPDSLGGQASLGVVSADIRATKSSEA
ncbi:MAG: arsenite methyltransferase [Thermoplasmata archaeon]